jgi:hypothetical protein
MIRILMLAALVLLAACDTITPPFAGDRPTPIRDIFTLKDSASIAVAPLAGVAPSAADKAAGAVADALQDVDILADAGDAGGDRLSLAGTAHAAGTGVAVDWRLTDHAGNTVGQTTSTAPVSIDAVNHGDADALKRLAQAAAAPVAALLQDDVSEIGQPPTGQPQQQQQHDTNRHVVVRSVKGAPGDGPESLRLAMAAALTQAKLSIVPSNGDTASALSVVGTVKLDPPKNGKQHVAINWALMDAGGRQLGIVSQQNDVQSGTLDGRWGDVANAVASAAAPGIVALIAKAEKTKPSS